jgi:hypothetical protein
MSDSERRKRRAQFSVEPLEGRVVLSGMHHAAVVNPAALIKGAGYLFLSGTVHGKATGPTPPPIPDLASSESLEGKGRLSPLGQIHFSGTLHGTGFIAKGPETGTLTLTNKKGSVTLKLVGPTVNGFTPPQSGTYQFSIASGTKAFAKDIGSGTVDIVLSSNKVTLTFHGAPNRY